MRTATAILSLLALVGPGCGDDDANLDQGDAGSPDAMPIPEACLDPEPGIICTIAGKGTAGYSGDDGPAIQAEFSLPQDMLMADNGDMYVLDWNNHRLRVIRANGTIEHVAGRGELGGDLDDPGGQDFNHPTNLVFTDEDQDNVLIAAWHNSKIRQIDLESGDVTDYAGTGKRAHEQDDGAFRLVLESRGLKRWAGWPAVLWRAFQRLEHRTPACLAGHIDPLCIAILTKEKSHAQSTAAQPQIAGR